MHDARRPSTTNTADARCTMTTDGAPRTMHKRSRAGPYNAAVIVLGTVTMACVDVHSTTDGRGSGLKAEGQPCENATGTRADCGAGTSVRRDAVSHSASHQPPAARRPARSI